MSLLQTCVSLVRKYGPTAKVVTTGVLNVVAPGSGALVELAGRAIDAASESAEQIARADWERQVLARLGQSEAELARLAQLLEYLTGPLAAICDKAAAFADQPADLPEIIQRAIAANPSLSKVLHEIGNLKEQFGVFQADIRRLAERQDEAAGVYARMHRVADYFDELWQAGVQPKDFVRLLQQRTEVVASIERGQTQGVDAVLLELRAATPKAASVPVLEAAAAVRAFDYPAAQRALDTAVRLKPDDTELLELSRRVTGLTNRAKSNQPSPAPAAAASAATTGSGRLQPGDELDGWRLGERLGAGGWGQVFKATRGGQTRALKVLHADYARDQRFVDRFKKEIAALQRLPRHANLVRIDDFGYCDERRTWYLTMEYVEGPTLERYLAEKGPLSEGEAREWFTAVVDGLAQAHAVGLVHRDIKPGNLILRASDRRLGVGGLRAGGGGGGYGADAGGWADGGFRGPGAALRGVGDAGQRRVQPVCGDALCVALRQAGATQAASVHGFVGPGVVAGGDEPGAGEQRGGTVGRCGAAIAGVEAASQPTREGGSRRVTAHAFGGPDLARHRRRFRRV
jgi:hypothetical protein